MSDVSDLSDMRTPPHAGELRFRIPETSDLDGVAEAVRRLAMADQRILAIPAPTVLLVGPVTSGPLTSLSGSPPLMTSSRP